MTRHGEDPSPARYARPIDGAGRDALLRELSESVGVIYWLGDATTLAPLYISPAIEEAVGVPLPGLARDPLLIRALTLDEDLPVRDGLLARARAGERAAGTYRIRSIDGETHWIDATFVPLHDETGAVTQIACVGRDLTGERISAARDAVEKQRLEARLADRSEHVKQLERQRAEAEKFAVAGRMAARIAHEINNPLAGVRNAFLLFKDAIPPDHPDHEFVRLVEREIGRMTAIVRQMYELYRPAAPGGRTPVTPPTSTRVVLDDVGALLAPLCTERGVTLVREACDGAVRLALPEHQLRQVLFNLAQNAVHVSGPGGTVQVIERRPGGDVIFEVTDSGPGIPPEIAEHLFEPFFTTKSATPFAGLGLGLSIVQGIVTAAGGEIGHEPRAGGGTVFRVRLPVA